MPSVAAFSYQRLAVSKILRDANTIFAELTQMSHCPGMTKLGRPFVPHNRSRQIFRDADAVFEHSAEIIHRARMAAIGSIQIIFDCLQLLISQRKRSAELKHKGRIGRIGFKGSSAC